MRSLQFQLALCAVCVLRTDLDAYAIEASMAENSSVLQTLRNFDSIYESGFTVSGTRQSEDIILRGRLSLDVKRRWRLTFDGDRVGYAMEVISYQKPEYQPSARRDSDADETLRIAVRTRQWGYWGHDLSGNHYEDTVIAVTPAGQVTETGKMHNSSLFGPRDEGPLAPRRAFLWSLGRFFSKHLDQVTRVEESADGRLTVSALGRKGERQPGRWELEIDPAAAWMVRKARFYWDIKPDRVNVEMRNEGAVWSGSYCIPQEAFVNHWGPIENKETEHMIFAPVVEEFDEQLYRDTQEAVAHNRTPTLTIHDYRVSPPIIVEPFRPTISPAKASLDNSAVARPWLLVGNMVVIFALIVFLVLQKRRRAREGAAGE